MHDSRTIANRFLELAHRNGGSLTAMQLIKLVYIANGWMLGLYGRPLIKDEIQAWQYGPVVPRLYNAVRENRGNPISQPLPATEPQNALSVEEQGVVDEVYRVYGRLSGPALSRLTHAKGTPWDVTYKPGAFGVTIPTDIIEDHYVALAAERRGG